VNEGDPVCVSTSEKDAKACGRVHVEAVSSTWGGPLCSPALCMCVSVAMAVCLRGVVGRGRPLWWACACTLGNVCECAQERMGATGAWAAVAWGRDP
jgi:hypothetical protein